MKTFQEIREASKAKKASYLKRAIGTSDHDVDQTHHGEDENLPNIKGAGKGLGMMPHQYFGKGERAAAKRAMKKRTSGITRAVKSLGGSGTRHGEYLKKVAKKYGKAVVKAADDDARPKGGDWEKVDRRKAGINRAIGKLARK